MEIIEMKVYVVIGIAGIIVGAFIGYFFRKNKLRKSYNRIARLEENNLERDFEILHLQKENIELKQLLKENYNKIK
jgi:hypothetical protein